MGATGRRRPRRPRLATGAALVLVTVLAVGACSGDEAAGPPDAGPTSSLIPGGSLPPPTSPGPVVAPEVLDAVPGPVAVVDLAFEPATIEVAVGGTVTWTNEGDEDHWVLGDDPDVVDSAPLEPGNSFAQRFDEVGTFGYHCNVHAGMRGTVMVGPASADG